MTALVLSLWLAAAPSTPPSWSRVHPVGPVLVLEQEGLVVGQREAQRCARDCGDNFRNLSTFTLRAVDGAGVERWVNEETPRWLGVLRDAKGEASALLAVDPSGLHAAVLDPATGKMRVHCAVVGGVHAVGSTVSLTPSVNARGELRYDLALTGPVAGPGRVRLRFDARDDQCSLTLVETDPVNSLPPSVAARAPKGFTLKSRHDQHGRTTTVKGKGVDVRVETLTVEGPCAPVQGPCVPPG